MNQKEAIEATKTEHELELARLGQGRNVTERAELREDRAKAPKLPSFIDGKDDLDAYLQRFERFATTAKWEKTGWASKLSALLSGRALEVYSRSSEEAAQDYDRMNLALMKRYDLTEDGGYRYKFRASKSEVDESPEQFIVRLDRYLLRWLELSNTERCFEGLKGSRCFDTVFQRPYRYFSIALKVVFSLSDRYKIFTSNWLWIEICENVIVS